MKKKRNVYKKVALFFKCATFFQKTKNVTVLDLKHDGAEGGI